MSGDRKIHSRDSQEANEEKLEIALTISTFEERNSFAGIHLRGRSQFFQSY